MDKSGKLGNNSARLELIRQAHKLLQPDKTDGGEQAVFFSKVRFYHAKEEVYKQLEDIEQIFITHRHQPFALMRKLSRLEAKTLEQGGQDLSPQINYAQIFVLFGNW